VNKVVKERFDEYPENARIRLEELRNLVFQIASELELGEVDETLKCKNRQPAKNGLEAGIA
jgi:hypothetical protein